MPRDHRAWRLCLSLSLPRTPPLSLFLSLSLSLSHTHALSHHRAWRLCAGGSVRVCMPESCDASTPPTVDCIPERFIEPDAAPASWREGSVRAKEGHLKNVKRAFAVTPRPESGRDCLIYATFAPSRELRGVNGPNGRELSTDGASTLECWKG